MSENEPVEQRTPHPDPQPGTRAASTEQSLAPALLAIVKEMGEQRKALQDEHARAAKERQSEHRWRLLFQGLFFGGPVLISVLYFVFFLSSSGIRFGPFADVVGVVRIEGEIGPQKTASAENVIRSLEKAFSSSHVKAIVLSIDSPGGSPAEAESIYSAVRTLKAKYDKPVVSVIRNLGASAGYMIAMHTDKVIAGRMSLVGSIGAIMAPWQLDRAIARLEVSQRVYASGKLKAFMNPFTAVSPEADAKAKRLVDQMGSAFVKDLREARAGALKAGVDYGTGEVWGGIEAKELGLIDALGTLDDVVSSTWGLKTYDFGPRETSFGMLSSSMSAWVSGAIEQVIARSLSLSLK
ncbi:MAG: S49 family peptidase [Candidatus Methylophosphatis roskildensis]